MTADQAGLGDGRVSPGNQGAWEVHFGDSVQLSPAVTYLGMDHESVWTRATLSFTATRETEKIEFFSKTVNVAASKPFIYILVDGITVTPNTPECQDPPTIMPTFASPSVTPTMANSVPGGRYCYIEDPSIYIILADDLQSLEVGGQHANICDNGCVVTETSPNTYTLTDNSGSRLAWGSGGFSIEDSTLTWVNKVVFTKEACTSITPSSDPTASTPTASPITTRNCGELALGSNDVVVDGSFEALRSVAATSEFYRLNGNVRGAGWHNGVKTADSLLAPLITTDPFTTHNVPESPDGGVFAGAGAVFNGYTESFWTEIEGLTPGASYNVNFWQSMTADQNGLGDGRCTPGNQGAWEVHFGDSVQLSPALTYLGMDHESVWTRATLSFTATNAIERIEFFSKTVSVVSESASPWVYMIIDGITVTPNTAECQDPTSAPSSTKPSKTPSPEPTVSTPTALPSITPSYEPTASTSTASPITTTNCAELGLGSNGVVVDGSFEALRSIAATSQNY